MTDRHISDEDGNWSVAVVIPAKNEESTIQACITSILAAAMLIPAPVWIVVVADSCTDKTVELAQAAVEGIGEVITCNSSSPGTARRLGVAVALAHFRAVRLSQVWIANTDADSSVPIDWLTLQLQYANEGAAAVAGVIKVTEVPGQTAEVMSLLMGDYSVNPDGTHNHVHGANFGVRADAYVDAGGWKDIALAEDHCLWNRLRSQGWSIVSSIVSEVMTSGRLEGRAQGGFADLLKLKLAQFDANA